MFSRPAAQPEAQAAAKGTAPPALAASITDAMRAAPAFTAYDLTVHLRPATATLETEARLTLRNDGAVPLGTLPLQLSSSLVFQAIRSNGKVLPFAVHRIASDADHTGAFTEAAVALPAPLAPGGTLALTVDYAGMVEPTSGRLDRAGASATLARQTDWDRIADGFTALRGFGNTVWYPVASVPALLGEDAGLAREAERQKRRNSGATVAMTVTLEFTGDAPNIAVLDGHRIPMPAPATLPTATFPGVLNLSLPPTPLGFRAPSLVLATRDQAAGNAFLTVGALPANREAAQGYTAAANLLEPLFHDWFGGAPKQPLALIDLPTANALPFDDAAALLLSLSAAQAAQPSQLAGALAEPLTHVYFHSPRPWLREGVAGLIQFLWTERTDGRDKALAQLGAARAALALAEPASPGSSPGQPLPTATQSVFYRTKATYVLLMLRSLVGDTALRAALHAYDPLRDTSADYFESCVQNAIGEAVPSGELHSFFRNWVLSDPGLPDLAISNVYSSRTGAGDQWLVAVEVANTGYAAATVPLTVHSAGTASTVQLQVPARGNVSRRVLILGQPTEVDLNDGSVPEVEASVHQRLIQ